MSTQYTKTGNRTMAGQTIKRKDAARRKSYQTIRAKLVEKDSSLRAWAMDNGYDASTVRLAVQRYAGGATMPRARLTFRILVEVSRFTGIEVVPGILAVAEEDAA